jgi:hypothetical protein
MGGLRFGRTGYCASTFCGSQPDIPEKREKGLFVFGLMEKSTWLRRYSISGTGHRMSFTKFAPMMGIFISCDSKHRHPTSRGIWCHSGNYRKIGDERYASMLLPMYGHLLNVYA